ncbi:MAG: hypothetical protein WA672_14075, partial [Candidatus Angelobacter sp.]
MTDEQVQSVIQLALQEAGLWEAVNQAESQFLDVGHVYTHLVLDDASKYEQAIEALRQLKLSSASDLEYIVRSKWEIVEVSYHGPYYDAAGNLYTSSDIGVTLASKSRIHTLRVAVS